MTNTTLEQRSKSLDEAVSIGPLARDTLVNKFDVLVDRFENNNQYYDRSTLSHKLYRFINKLGVVVRTIDPEDLEQELHLLRLEAKAEADKFWPHTYRCKVISFIQNYDITPTEPYDEESAKALHYNPLATYIQDSVFNLHFTSGALSQFQRQIVHLHMTDGGSINDLAYFYHVDRSTVRSWLNEIYSKLRVEWED